MRPSCRRWCSSPPRTALPNTTPLELRAGAVEREPLTELRSPFVLSDTHLRRLLDGLLLMSGPRADWANLLRRSHDIDVLDCPRCHGRLRLRAILRDEAQARRVVHYLEAPPPRAGDPNSGLDSAA